MALDSYVTRYDLGVVIPDVGLLFRTGQFLRPDLLVVPESSRAGITNRGIELAPSLVVEILSPTSRSCSGPCRPDAPPCGWGFATRILTAAGVLERGLVQGH
jgi:hypothetical protein